MTERPIIFSAGRKTQTRRIVKGVEECPHGYDGVVTATVPKEAHLVGKHCFNLASGESLYLRCPYGAPGDKLWVRETSFYCNGDESWLYRADGVDLRKDVGTLFANRLKWTPAFHMPRAASRLRLEVTGVRVERLFKITEADCRAEGMLKTRFYAQIPGEPSLGWTSDKGQPVSTTARRAFEDLWHSINGAWLDCWVWVIEFRREQ